MLDDKYYIRLKITPATVKRLHLLIGINKFNVEEFQGHWYWLAESLESLPDSRSRYQQANKEVAALNQVLKMFASHPKLAETVEATAIGSFKKEPNGAQTMKMDPNEAVLAATFPLFVAEFHVSVGSSGNPLADKANLYFDVLKNCPDIYEVSKRINEIDYLQFEFWKAKEAMVGKKHTLARKKYQYLNETEYDEFKKWANNPEASGENARHWQPEPNQSKIRNITDDEARRYMRKAFKNWINDKCGKTIL